MLLCTQTSKEKSLKVDTCLRIFLCIYVHGVRIMVHGVRLLWYNLISKCCVSIFPVDLVTYITRFQWDMAKYPIKQSLKNISEIISKVWNKSNNKPLFKVFHIFLFIELWQCLFSHRVQQVTQIDNDLKTRASAYNNLKGNLQNLERKNA